MARNEGLRIYEVGISYHGRTYEEGKKIGLRDAFRALYCVLKYNTTSLAKFTRYGMMGVLVALSQLGAITGLVGVGGTSRCPRGEHRQRHQHRGVHPRGVFSA